MDARPREEAAKPENRDKYVLCVVDIANGNVNDAVVREKARFVFGVGLLVEAKVNEAKGFKNHEGELKQSGDGAVGIDIVESSVKFRIGAQVWCGQGVSLHEFVERVKQGF